MEVGDLETNQHASITVYHQPKDVLVDNSEDGYLILNSEAIEMIRQTKEEGEESGEEEREEGSGESGESDCIEEESEDDCVEVVDPRESEKRERSDEEESSKRVQVCLLVCLQKFNMSQDFENLKRIVLERRSVRMFNKQPLPEGVLETILGYSLVLSLHCDDILENSYLPQPSALSCDCSPQ